MNIRNFLQRLVRNDFFVALAILGAFLLTNRYIFGWDNQHLEIPLLKHLIDPTLFAGDYYVEGLSRHFSTFLFPLLSRVITVEMIPATYVVLFCVARFFMFYWIYRLWQWISGGDRLSAFCATLGLFLLGRSEDFIVRTFSHESFTYAIIFAGVYYFYRERFVLASVILGVAANFHALYALFPMMYIAVYAFFFIRDGKKTFFITGIVFVLLSMPFLLWHLPQAFQGRAPIPASEWVPLYLLSCPQCFPLGTANPQDIAVGLWDVLGRLYPYLFWVLLYAAHCVLNQEFRKDNKVHVIFWVSAVMIGLSFFFAYVVPSRFVLDLNIGRMAQYVNFFLMGYTAVFLMKIARRDKPVYAITAGFAFLLIGLSNTAAAFSHLAGHWRILIALIALSCLLVWKQNSRMAEILKRSFLVIPLVGMFISYCILHYHFVQIQTRGAGFWQLQRNWEDMQHYVKDHTPKNALLLTPYDMEMGGFRIHSDRRVLVCYRDCGIIGFDYQAVKEWERRIKDIEAFKVFTKQDIRPALMNAIGQYGVTHIVFMRYYEPQGEVGFLKKMYSNEIFSLYRVVR